MRWQRMRWSAESVVRMLAGGEYHNASKINIDRDSSHRLAVSSHLIQARSSWKKAARFVKSVHSENLLYSTPFRGVDTRMSVNQAARSMLQRTVCRFR